MMILIRGAFFFIDKYLQEIAIHLKNNKNTYLKEKKPTIAIAHHGLDYFDNNEEERFKSIFGDSIDLYLCGHTHINNLRETKEKEFSLTQITCGGDNNHQNSSSLHGQFINGEHY
jgi:UDP-2,3-diacylglucosamine pyrophosphatase LpxH